MIKLSVLYIEDNPYDADLVNAYLEQSAWAEFSVVWVKDLKDADLQLDQHDFHLVMLDFDLPSLDTFDSLRSLKHLGKNCSIVIYTSLSESDRALESLKIGADDFLLKENVDADSLAKSLLFAYQRRQRIKALEEVNSNLQKFNAAAEQSANTVVITNIKGEIEYVNQKFVEVTGYTKEEVIGNNPRVLKSGKQDRSYYEELWQTVLSGKPWRGKFENIKKDGTPFWEEAVISPITNKDGEVTHFVANKENVTEKKFLSDELEATLRRLERSHDIAKLGSFEYDFERQEFIHVCKHVADLLPVDIELFFQDYSSCAERHDCDCGHSNQLDRCRREEQAQCIYYIPSKEIYIEITSQPLLENGKLKKCSGTVQNVTESMVSAQEVTRQRDQFKSFFESEAVGVLHIDTEGNVQEVNQAMIDLLGLESKSQYPKNVFEV